MITRLQDYRIAVLIPCLNEGLIIKKVVQDFKKNLPDAIIYVCDNNSTDNTIEEAKLAGAIILIEAVPGKGNAVRRLFSNVESDIYILVDGDGTYDAKSALGMCNLLLEGQFDVVVGKRIASEADAYRSGHKFGNLILTGLVAKIFGNGITDMLTGYRVMTRRFVKSFPAHSRGFEIETELTTHALEQRIRMIEHSTIYTSRIEGSNSKLRTYSDGFNILHTILDLFRNEKPLIFYSIIGVLLYVTSITLSIPIFFEFIQNGTVSKLPTALFCTGLCLIGALSIAVGLVLDSVSRGRKEAKYFQFLREKSPFSLN